MTSVSIKLLVLKTREMERLLAFYRALGIELAEERHGKGPLHFAGMAGEAVFELYPTATNEPLDINVRLGFAVPHLAQTIEFLRAANTQIVGEPKATEWGTRAVVRDPDGRSVELYQQ